MINIGDYVIVNDIDRPSERLVAKITKIEQDDLGLILYSSRYINSDVYAGNRHEIKTYNPTKVEDFGFRVVICDVMIKYRVIEEISFKKTATYMDGRPRRWQGDSEDILDLASWCCNG